MSELDDLSEQLRAAILRGDFAPRQRLIETELATQYASSRFSIRNAINQLAADGLVEIQPNRGARVREITVEEAVEITEIRWAIEGLAARRAAERITDDEIAALRDLGSQMTEAVESGELMSYSDLNANLHSRIRELAANATASKIIGQLNGQMVRHQFRLSLLPGRPAVSLPEHLAIIEAVCTRDPDRAELAMRAHVGSVIQTLASFGDMQRTSRAHDLP